MRPPRIDSRGRVSRTLAAICLIAVVLAIPAAVVPALGEEAASNSPKSAASLSTAPDFSAVGIDGKTYQLSALLKQGPVLLDFWTTWCKPCMLEMPKLQEIWLKHKDKGFTLVGIPSDDQKSAAKVKPTIQSKGFKFLNLPDPTRKIGNLYNVRNYPTTVLIAPDGSIAKYTLGFNPGDEKELEAKILSLLGGTEAK